MEDLVPPGFRFYPTEEELISFYLRHTLDGTRPELNHIVPILDIYTLEPWDLPSRAGERSRTEPEQWFFFVPQQEREARGGKPNRTTVTGYWKATGSPTYVYSTTHMRAIGVKKTMVFHKGRAPIGRKTKWKMNEYKAIESTCSSLTNAASIPKLRQEMSVCRVYITSGSSRAFDRRPSAITIQNPIHSALCASPRIIEAQAPLAPENTSPVSVSDGSGSGGKGRGSMSFFDDEILSGLEPFWEWEQLKWP